VKIAAFDLFQYTLELSRPLTVRGQKLQNRQGLIIRLISEQGDEGFGDVAPLPGFSQETLSEALVQMQFLRSKLRDQAIPERLTKFSGQFDQWLDSFDLRPSARFGFESAVLHLLANAHHAPVHKLIPATTYHPVRVTGLLSGDKKQLITQTKELIGQGFSALKLKVGGDIDEDIEKVLTVNNLAYGKALLYLDANQMWDFEEAVSFGKAIGCAAASYIEEPFKGISRIPEFFDQTLIPVALDESIKGLSLEEIRAISGVETIVIKPTMLGSIEKTLQLLTQAENFALDAVISSSFESSIGLWMLANIVEASTHNTAAGLDTLKWFRSDVLKKPVAIKNGKIDIDKQLIHKRDIDFDLLHKL
jgi:O-succinylbenzoate synthase